MSDFNVAIPFILLHEGGYVNDPKDNGGETNYGISKRTYSGLDIKSLTRDQACVIYKRDFWDKNKYGLINDQAVATKIFDMCVNMGASQAHKIVQKALLSLGKNVDVDGVLGPISVACINEAVPALIYLICDLQKDFYRGLVTANPKEEKFLNGWLSRASFLGR